MELIIPFVNMNVCNSDEEYVLLGAAGSFVEVWADPFSHPVKNTDVKRINEVKRNTEINLNLFITINSHYLDKVSL